MFALTAATAAQSPAPQKPPMDLMLETCTGYCHSANLIAQQRLDRNGWNRELDKMIRWGAVVPANEREILLTYLVRTFSPNRPRPNTNVALPEGKARELALVACMSCHDDRVLNSHRTDRAGWERHVDLMIKWGAHVPAARKAELIDYLSTHWGRP